MKDMGIIRGSATQAVPLIMGTDTVYVHADIQELPPDENGSVVYEYRELQFDRDEYACLTYLISERKRKPKTNLRPESEATTNE